MKRRKFMAQTGSALMAVPFINLNRYHLFENSTQEYSRRAIDLVNEAVVVDMLNQFAWNQFSNPRVLDQWLSDPSAFSEKNAQSFIDSGIDVFALGHARQTKRESLDYFTSWNKFISGNLHWLKRIDAVGDLSYVNRAGKTGILLSFQDSKHFDEVEDVDLFYSMGQRLSQLTYNYQNRIGSGAFDDKDDGLTEFGRRIVGQMNAVGMAIDLSHCSDKTTLEGIELSSTPVIVTHANCRALNPGHPRAKTDEMIRHLAVKGGMMGIAEIRFMVRDKEPVTVEHFLDHYDHILKLVGVEHAGIGTDFDLETEDNPAYLEGRKKMFADINGERARKYRMHTDDKYQVGIENINHPKRTYDIVEGFIRRNYSDESIRLILGGNFIRVAGKIWK